MIGKPKFKIGDSVKFTLDGKLYYGQIYIVDAYGTWDDPSDISYDIMVNNWGDNNDKECLFKHITEKLVEENIKTFAELKPGDIIYYYDHGKMHPQIVYDINITQEEYKYKDWFGNENIQINKYIVLVAGKHKKTYKLSKFTAVSYTDIYYRMRRFSCKEAANKYLEERINKGLRKLNKAQTIVDKYNKLLKKYTESAKELSNNI